MGNRSQEGGSEERDPANTGIGGVMLRKLRTDFLQGIDRIRWFSGVLSERLNIEIAVIKLLFKSDDIERKKNELLTTLGTRVYELKDQTEKNLLKDRVIVEALA